MTHRPSLTQFFHTFGGGKGGGDAVRDFFATFRSIQVWQEYLDMLRSVVAPLVRDLTQKGGINWYPFLVHNWESGVLTKRDDDKLYVHLRMVLTKATNEEEFIKQLPSFCHFSSYWFWAEGMENSECRRPIIESL